MCIWPDLGHDGNSNLTLAEPGRPLPGPLHYPLAFVLFAWHLALIQDDGLRCRGPQGATLHFADLPANLSGFPAHLLIAEATQDVLLLQVATLWTGLNVVLGPGERHKTDRQKEKNEKMKEGQNESSKKVFIMLILLQLFLVQQNGTVKQTSI